MRLIDADALKEVIANNVYVVSDCINSRDYGMFWTGGIEKAIDDAPTATEWKMGEWIPCSERLPEEDGDYLVTYEEGYADDYGLDMPLSIAPFEVDCESFGYWYEKFDHVSLGSLGSDWEMLPVIAWMPLPKPYEDDNDD